MTVDTRSAREARLDELRRQRAADMLAAIERRPLVNTSELQTGVLRLGGAAPGAGEGARTTLRIAARAGVPPGNRPRLRGCAARELEWLITGGIAVVLEAVLRTSKAPRVKYGIGSPYLPSMLIVTYETRYFLAEPARGARSVYVMHGALQTTSVPVGRDLRRL
jgi:hypothetical protein